MKLKILLADDHAILRDGIEALLERHGGFEIVASVADGQQAIDVAASTAPDLCILDVQMPRMDGIEAARAIIAARPAVRILMLSMQSDPESVYRALQAGAMGYLLKGDATAELLEAASALAAGQRYLSRGIDEQAVSDYLGGRRDAGPLERLSPRERNLLQLIVEGHTNAEAARVLSLSVKTIETYRSRMMLKLGINDVPSLVKFALVHGVTRLA